MLGCTVYGTNTTCSLTTICWYWAVVPGWLWCEAPDPVLKLSRVPAKVSSTIQLRIETRMKEVWFIPWLAVLSSLGGCQLTSVALPMVWRAVAVIYIVFGERKAEKWESEDGRGGSKGYIDLDSWSKVMSLSPTSVRELFFPFPWVYSALPQKMGRYFYPILWRGCQTISHTMVGNPKGKINFGNVTLDHPPFIVLHMYMYATNIFLFKKEREREACMWIIYQSTSSNEDHMCNKLR